MRLSIWEGIFSTAFGVLTGGAFQIGFARSLGASDFSLGLIAALAAAVNVLVLPAAIYVSRRREQRLFVGWMAAWGRWLYVPILLLPFCLPPALRLGAFLVLITISGALLSVSTLGWMGWVGVMVPPSIRGAYFGRRNMLGALASVLVPLPAGAFLDLAVRYHRFDPRLGFAALFGVAVFIAVICLLLILRHPEGPPPSAAEMEETAPSGLQALLTPITADANFRWFLISAAATTFGQGMAAQFFLAWQLDAKGLHLSYLIVQILGAVTAAAGMAAMPFLGLLGDRFGSRPVLILMSALVIIAPFIWLFTLPTAHALLLNVGLIVLLNLFSGVAWAGIGLAQFNLLLALSPPRGVGTYSAILSAVTGVLGAIAPLIGGILMGALANLSLPVSHGIVLNNYKALFLLTGLMRIGFLFTVSPIKEPKSTGARHVLRKIAEGARRPGDAYRVLRQQEEGSDNSGSNDGT